MGTNFSAGTRRTVYEDLFKSSPIFAAQLRKQALLVRCAPYEIDPYAYVIESHHENPFLQHLFAKVHYHHQQTFALAEEAQSGALRIPTQPEIFEISGLPIPPSTNLDSLDGLNEIIDENRVRIYSRNPLSLLQPSLRVLEQRERGWTSKARWG